MHDDMASAQDQTREMVSKMTQIYKNMEKSYNEKIELSVSIVTAQDREQRKLKEEIQELQKAKEDMITKYDTNILKLKERIETMSTDFAKMLRTTLTKMQERIDDANQTYDADQPGHNQEGTIAAAAAQIFGEQPEM